MPDEKKVERIALLIFRAVVNLPADGSGDTEHTEDEASCVEYLNAARAVLSAVPSYAQGWNDAVEAAVKAAEDCNCTNEDCNGPCEAFDGILAAILSLAKKEETHDCPTCGKHDDTKGCRGPASVLDGRCSMWIAAHPKEGT